MSELFSLDFYVERDSDDTPRTYPLDIDGYSTFGRTRDFLELGSIG